LHLRGIHLLALVLRAQVSLHAVELERHELVQFAVLVALVVRLCEGSVSARELLFELTDALLRRRRHLFDLTAAIATNKRNRHERGRCLLRGSSMPSRIFASSSASICTLRASRSTALGTRNVPRSRRL